jgi:hypothetical protein
MATPGESPLIDLQAAYAAICAEIRDVLLAPRPDYSIDGVSVSFAAYYQSLIERQEVLRKIPGVAPTTNPIFDVYG